MEHLLRQDRLTEAAAIGRMMGDQAEGEPGALAAMARDHSERAERLELPGRSAQPPPENMVHFRDDRLKWIISHLSADPTIRRVAIPGCGDGLHVRLLRIYTQAELEAWDPDAQMVAIGNATREWMAFPTLAGAAHRPLLSPPQSPPDAVLLLDVLEHVPESRHAQVIETCLSWIRPGGRLLLTVPKGPKDPDGGGPRPDNLRASALSADHLRRIGLTHQLAEEIAGETPWLGLAIRKHRTEGIRPRDVAFICPSALEEWGPFSLKKGIGGSEESVIRLSRELAKRGHRVTVYGDWEGEDSSNLGDWCIRYRHPRHYRRADICVGWRAPEVFHQRRLPDAEWLWLWLHDTIEPERLKPVLPHVDALLVGSYFHANLYPEAAALARVVRYGVEPREFPTSLVRTAEKFVWTSCPTRGLETLLDRWAAIRSRVPKAELHVFYGFGNLDAMLKTRPKTPDTTRLLEVKNRILVKRDQPGVVWRGRVGHDEIAYEMVSAGVLAYPCNFPEIMAISAAKAQAAGCWPVYYPVAALPETIAWGWPTSEATLVEDAVAAATGGKPESEREAMRRWAKECFSWERVALAWEELMLGG